MIKTREALTSKGQEGVSKKGVGGGGILPRQRKERKSKLGLGRGQLQCSWIGESQGWESRELAGAEETVGKES